MTELAKLVTALTVVGFWLLLGMWWTFDGCKPGEVAIPMHDGWYCAQATKWVGK